MRLPIRRVGELKVGPGPPRSVERGTTQQHQSIVTILDGLDLAVAVIFTSGECSIPVV